MNEILEKPVTYTSNLWQFTQKVFLFFQEEIKGKTIPKDDSKFLGLIEEHLTSIVYDLTTEICWSTLWDSARKLKQKEVEQLEDIYQDKEPDSSMLNILRANYNHPLTQDQVPRSNL